MTNTETDLFGNITRAAAAKRVEKPAEQSLPLLGGSLAIDVARHFLKVIIRKLAEIFRGALVVGLVVEIAVSGICGDKAIVILLGFLIIDGAAATEAAHEVIYSSWHSQCGFGLKVRFVSTLELSAHACKSCREY